MKKRWVFLLTTVAFWAVATPFLVNFGEEKGITSLALVSHSRDELKSEAVAEWLDLSSDQYTSLSSFNLRDGAEKLLKSGLIDQVQLYKLKPSTLVVSYRLREPYATIANWKNLGVDREGNVFSLYPFFSPKELPEIVLKEEGQLDFTPLKETHFAPFFEAKKILLMELLLFPWTFSRLDLSRMNQGHPYGGEVVLTLKNGEKGLFIRLWREDIESVLQKLAPLLECLPEAGGVDLRVPSRTLVF